MKILLLDYGYIELVKPNGVWGSDEAIIEAARMSTNKGFLGWGPKHKDDCACVGKTPPLQSDCTCGELVAGDEKLLAYLWNNKHRTPFEMAGMVIEVKAPIMVFREWHRHRTQSYNEMSARYIPLPDENYMPDTDRVGFLGRTLGNKQASGLREGVMEIEDVQTFRDELKALYVQAQTVYELGLKLGVPKELARLSVPVARYSKMRACANLRNWLAFLTLRMAPTAQWEIRQYANAVGQIVANQFPRTWELFNAESK